MSFDRSNLQLLKKRTQLSTSAGVVGSFRRPSGLTNKIGHTEISQTSAAVQFKNAFLADESKYSLTRNEAEISNLHSGKHDDGMVHLSKSSHLTTRMLDQRKSTSSAEELMKPEFCLLEFASEVPSSSTSSSSGVISKRPYQCIAIGWKCESCLVECIPVRRESRCLCGHRLKEHRQGAALSDPFPCQTRGCPCASFFFVVAEGAWTLRCRCKHKVWIILLL